MFFFRGSASGVNHRHGVFAVPAIRTGALTEQLPVGVKADLRGVLAGAVNPGHETAIVHGLQFSHVPGVAFSAAHHFGAGPILKILPGQLGE